MKRKLPLLAALLGMAIALAVFLPSAFANVSTDLNTYQAGDTVYITGDGMTANEAVSVDITAPDNSLAQKHQVAADDSGDFTDSYVLPADAQGGIYTVTATGQESGTVESTTFDPPPPPSGTSTVQWTGNGVGSDGQTCNNNTDHDQLNPSPGQKGWFFVLNQISGDPADWRLSVDFSGTADDKNNLTPTQTTSGVAKWAVYSATGATLLGATATSTASGGTSDGNLVVSHCFPTDKLTPSVSTTIVFADGTAVSGNPPTVDVNTPVHDTATVTGTGTGPTPTGTVTFTLHHSSDCLGDSVGTSTGTLNNSGVAASDPFTPSTSGDWSYSAHYNGDATYLTADAAACEPLTVKVNTASDLGVSKTATPSFDRTYKWGITKKADTDKVFSAGGGESGKVNYTVSVTHDDGTDGNWAVSGDITVTNGNAGDVTNVDVSDAINGETHATCNVDNGLPGNISPSKGTIPAGGSIDFAYTCSYTAAPAASSQTNTASVTWPDQVVDGSDLAGNTVTGTAGIDWSTVTPNIVNGSVDVSDDLKGDLGTVSYTDASPKTFEYALTFKDEAGTCTDHKNTATATINTVGDSVSPSVSSDPVTVTDCQGADLKVSKDATPSFTRTYTWDITKDADTNKVFSAGGGESGKVNYTVSVTHDSGTDSAWAVKGTITITNPNDWEDITLTSLDDALNVSGACTLDTAGPYVVPMASGGVDGSLQVGYTCATASASDTKNTATAKWDSDAAHTLDGSASGDASVVFTTPTTIVDGSVSVTDTLGGTLGTVSYTDDSPKTFKYSETFTDRAGTCTDHKNTASFTTSDTGTTDSASQTVTDCQGADLKVSKDATPSFTRTYKWGITKDVDKTSVKLIGGGSATFNYTVKASYDSGTDSAWAVKGTITITNPNDWEDITLTSLDDALNVSGACTLDTAGPYVVPKASGGVDGSLQVGYTCAAASATDTKNTATAKWDKDAAHTPNGSASGDASVAFSTPTKVVDNCVTVTDTFNGGAAQKLGVACVGGGWTKDAGNNLASFTESFTAPTFTFTYSRTIAAPPAGTCIDRSNTAAFKTNTTYTTGSADQKVTVCDYNAALTPGYWKNHLNVATFPQLLGSYSVNTSAKATSVFNAMNCSSSSSQDAIGCLAGHLLATEFNLANKSDPKIQAIVDKANNFLKGLTVDGVPGITYTGPSGTYTLTAAQRAEAIALKTALDNYNNGL